MELLRVPRASARGHWELSRSFQGKETVGLALLRAFNTVNIFFKNNWTPFVYAFGSINL